MAGKKIIVQGCGTAGLATMRALHRAGGYEIIAMSHSPDTEIGFVSRYASKVVHMPHPGHSEQEFVDFLMSNSPRWKDVLILETGDYMAVSLSKHKEQLSEYYRIVTPEWDVLKKFILKDALYELADACGVAHPLSLTPNSQEALEKIRSKILFPCIIKPADSHRFVRHFGTKMFHAENYDELVAHFKRSRDAGFTVIVQEVIPGPVEQLERMQAYVNSKGQMAATFFNAKVRQHPPGFGVMRIGKSTSYNEEVEEQTTRLLQKGGYKGYLSAEFKRDPRDQKLKLIEINVRMPRSGWLAAASGVNFPDMIYKDLVEDIQLSSSGYANDLHWIEIHTDLMNIVKNGRKEPYSLREYMGPYFKSRKAFAVWDIRDPRPFFRQTVNAIGKLRK